MSGCLSHTTALSVVSLSCCECSKSTKPIDRHKLLTLSDCSCQFVHEPFASGPQMRAKYGHLRAILPDLTILPPFPLLLFFEFMVMKTGCRDLILLLNFLIRQSATPFHAFRRVTFHVTRPSDRVRVGFLRTKELFFCSGGKSRFEQFSFLINTICIHVECMPSTRGQETMSVLQDRPVSSHFFSRRLRFRFPPSIFWQPRKQI